MKKQFSKIKYRFCFLAAVLLSVSVCSLQAKADFRETKELAAEIITPAVALDTSPAGIYAVCGSLDDHKDYGKWRMKDELNAEFHFKSTGNIAVIPAAQLDLMGTVISKDNSSGGKSSKYKSTCYNSSFTGTFSMSYKTAGKDEVDIQKDVTWEDEQTCGYVIPAGTQEIIVKYNLKVKENMDLPEWVVLTPEFSCALIQAANQPEGFQASCRKISDPNDTTQTGLTAVLGPDAVYWNTTTKFEEKYGPGAYTRKTLKITVTPDDADQETKVDIYRLDANSGTKGYSKAENKISGETITVQKEYSFDFIAKEGTKAVEYVVDASNGKAGHRIYHYVIEWPAGESLRWTRNELDLKGDILPSETK